MSTLILPLRNDLPHFKFQTELDANTYGFEFWWNYRIPGWIMYVTAADETKLVSGIRLVVDFPLLVRYKDERLPPGVLMAQDTAGQHADPGLTDLGTRVLLKYYPIGDL